LEQIGHTTKSAVESVGGVVGLVVGVGAGLAGAGEGVGSIPLHAFACLLISFTGKGLLHIGQSTIFSDAVTAGIAVDVGVVVAGAGVVVSRDVGGETGGVVGFVVVVVDVKDLFPRSDFSSSSC